MALELCVLASGSGGNCTVVRTPAGVMLIDAGLGPRTAAGRLKGTGVSVNDVSALCLTHLDRDHFNPNWLPTLIRRRIPVYCHLECAMDLLRTAGPVADDVAPLLRPFEDLPVEPLPGLTVQPISLAHDCEGSIGYLMEGFGGRIGYATDLGRVTDELVECFEGVDVLALESNYDRTMQLNSGRPWFLRQRIMGGRGHLSNDEALAAIKRILSGSAQRYGKLPAHIVLLHRSRQCNCPDVLRDLFSRDARIAPRLVLAEQLERTEWLQAVAQYERPLLGEQMALAWG